jgi:hypothetical protein
VTFGEETEDTLTEVFGGISAALARSFRLVDPDVRNPASRHWDRTFDLFRLVLQPVSQPITTFQARTVQLVTSPWTT